MDNFEKQKTLATSGIDFSRKGSIDSKILDLSIFINNQNDFFTTSSCSGRIILFDDKTDASEKVSNKQGCQWLFTSHDMVDTKQVIPVLTNITGNCVFKFEPFVLHVQCRTTQHAQLLLQCAVQSGFRNSGISLGKKGKIIVGVRSTHSMEVPLSHSGHLLVSTEYVEFLIKLANKKMEENFRRIDRFFESIKTAILQQMEEQLLSMESKEKKKNKHKLQEKVPSPDSVQSSDHSTQSCDLLDKDVLEFSLFDDDIT